ncbi:MAG: ATP-binding protein [Candidatus Omnitrophica bacterium]|nr:ATP-binding protein [Candidatus Omnitrophota bacterium]
MINNLIFTYVPGINVVLLIVAAYNFLRRRHIANLLAGFALLSVAVIECSKLSFLEGAHQSVLFGIGLFILPIVWFIFSIGILPVKKKFMYRMILAPILGVAGLIFFLILWIHPAVYFEKHDSVVILSHLAQYFSILFIINLAFTLSNLERSMTLSRRKYVRVLFLGTLFILVPYLFLATYAFLFKTINADIFFYSSVSIFIGAACYLALSRRGIAAEMVKEDTAVNTSLTLSMIGGYLFFIGAFIKIFQVFGWNLNVLFSVLTGLFLVIVFFVLVFSSAVKDRIKYFFLRSVTRQTYDWQKLWEDFTYQISLVTELPQIEEKLERAVKNIMDARLVKVIIFGAQIPFEAEFYDWMLRKAAPFNLSDTLYNGLGDKYPRAAAFFHAQHMEIVSPLYGDKKVIGIIGLDFEKKVFFDSELLKLLSLQASSVIVNCLAYQKIREAEKKESLYKLSSFIIHDVKNYVNNLSMLSANKDKFDNPEFQKDALFTLEHTIEKMKRLIEEFRALRGDLQLQKRPCAVSGLVDEALAELGQNRFKSIEVVKECAPGGIIDADPHYINKVLANLILNAIEAMDTKGTLTIKAETGDNTVSLKIQDTGCGMSKEFIDNHLFRPFQSTKEKGLGVGLYQCKTIIEAHGGTMRAESVPGEGTAFTIEMPASKSHDT